MNARDSQTHPIIVNFLPLENLAGRLGMTFAPGKVQSNAMTGAWDRDLDADLERLRQTYGCDVLVCLLEPRELIELEIGRLPIATWQHGIEYWHHPIPDTRAPDDLAALRVLVARILRTVSEGRTVVVHCMGGLGRTGTIAACAMIGLHTNPDRAIEMIRAERDGAIETVEQEAFVGTFAAAIRSSGRPNGGPVDRLAWKNHPLPAQRTWIDVGWNFTDDEFHRMVGGRMPLELEEQWFIYWERPWLHFHLSWTGAEVYSARIEPVRDGVRLLGFWANREEGQHDVTRDEVDEKKLLALIRELLLA